MSQKFQRRIEDFTCGHCGAHVTGNGYTNHCPICLYSRHVDIYPGDRAHRCQGLMAPVGVEQVADGFILTHRCVMCGETARCRSAPEDDTDTILRLAKEIATSNFR